MIIGIDLGTTNSTVACVYKEAAEHGALAEVKQIELSQFLTTGELGVAPTLPSFIYYPLPEESQKEGEKLPWDHESSHVIGTFARDRGAEVPTRLISSAKSWLCHSGIDRREKLLPLQYEEKDEQMSPLEACSELLKYLRQAWDSVQTESPLKDQTVLITVPASFDPAARQLVQEAANQAGYPETILLEEPQAAFYAWLHTHADTWRSKLKVGDTILVIDIGGGTTDFSLIRVCEEEGNLQLKREAVGDHLLLGGDNIDVGLAYLVKQKFEDQGHSIDHWQLQGLIHQCRQAKEKLLGEAPPRSVDITILGRGSRLIGNTLKAELSDDEVRQFVMNGFLPLVSPEEQSPPERKVGLKQVGLPYVQDPRISCQLAKFLSMTGESDGRGVEHFVVPTAVLFNGGTMKSVAIRTQLMTLLNQWAEQLGKSSVIELEGADYDYAVSRGAACYGLAREGHAVRIRSGTSRSYFVGIEEAVPAVPGISPPLRAICIVPFGMEEGEERELIEQEFALLLGEQASFRFFSHATPTLSDGQEPAVGTIVRNWKEELTELHPIEAILSKSDDDGKTARVTLRSKVTELGVLELWCVAANGHKWKLEFDIRQK